MLKMKFPLLKIFTIFLCCIFLFNTATQALDFSTQNLNAPLSSGESGLIEASGALTSNISLKADATFRNFTLFLAKNLLADGRDDTEVRKIVSDFISELTSESALLFFELKMQIDFSGIREAGGITYIPFLTSGPDRQNIPGSISISKANNPLIKQDPRWQRYNTYAALVQSRD